MEWREIKQSEQYEISNTGLIRKKDGGDLVSPYDNKGYLRIKLNGKNFLVHRLVAEAFIPNPDNLETVNHKNLNKKDNRVENLEWMSNADNIRHAVSNKDGRLECLQKSMSLVGKKYGAENGRRSRKPVAQYDLDGNLIAIFPSAREADKLTGIGYKQISAVCNGNKKTAHGYVWRFLESQSTIESTHMRKRVE